MTESSGEMPADPFDADDQPILDDAQVEAQQRGYLRRILVAFVVVVVLLPFVALGGMWGWFLLPMLYMAWRGLRDALRLRQSVNRYGAPRAR